MFLFGLRIDNDIVDKASGEVGVRPQDAIHESLHVRGAVAEAHGRHCEPFEASMACHGESVAMSPSDRELEEEA